MTTIHPARRILAQLRSQALAWKERSSAARIGGTSAPSSAVDPAAGWLAETAQRVAGIDRSDPDRRRKAFGVYLRAALARDLGIRRTEDPGFPYLVERVLETMESDAELRSAIDAAGDLLLTLADP